jgi:hypothetical protein
VQYILLIYGDESGSEGMASDDLGPMMQEYGDYTTWLRESGRYVAGEALQPTPQATTVRRAPRLDRDPPDRGLQPGGLTRRTSRAPTSSIGSSATSRDVRSRR